MLLILLVSLLMVFLDLDEYYSFVSFLFFQIIPGRSAAEARDSRNFMIVRRSIKVIILNIRVLVNVNLLF